MINRISYGLCETTPISKRDTFAGVVYIGMYGPVANIFIKYETPCEIYFKLEGNDNDAWDISKIFNFLKGKLFLNNVKYDVMSVILHGIDKKYGPNKTVVINKRLNEILCKINSEE